MDRTIKLREDVYNRLEEVRGKRETFSEAVGRLLFIRDTIAGVADTLGPSHYLMRRPDSVEETAAAADRR